MTFKELQAAMVSAMKEKNRVKKEVIADMVACAKNMAIEQGCKDNISDEIVSKAILKSKKMCQEQIDTCPANRPDLLEAFKTCMGYIDELAPKMMSYEEVYAFTADFITTMINLDTPVTNKGILIKSIISQLAGKADGKTVSLAVTNLLNGVK